MSTTHRFTIDWDGVSPRARLVSPVRPVTSITVIDCHGEAFRAPHILYDASGVVRWNHNREFEDYPYTMIVETPE